MADAESRGREASRPKEIPKAGWREVLFRVYVKMAADHVTSMAAGAAFYGMIAIFSVIAALISVGALFMEPSEIQNQLDNLASALPREVAFIVEEQAREVTSGEGLMAELAAIFSLFLALYSASRGVRTLIDGMNIVYDETETRGLIELNLTALGLTLLMIGGVLMALIVVVVAPIALGAVGLPETTRGWITYARWPTLALFTILGLAILYRYGPSRANPRWRWVSPGAVAGTLLWVIGSVLFSLYVRNFGDYNETYGALGGVLILLSWLWLSTFVILLGAELDAETEHQTRRDSTIGPDQPMGERGAVKADTLPRARPGRLAREDDSALNTRSMPGER